LENQLSKATHLSALFQGVRNGGNTHSITEHLPRCEIAGIGSVFRIELLRDSVSERFVCVSSFNILSIPVEKVTHSIKF